MTLVVAIVSVCAAVGGLGLWAVRREKARVRQLQALAQTLGWTFEERPAAEVAAGLPTLEMFAAGRRHVLRNRLSGSRGGVKVSAFDLSYVTGQPTGKTKTAWVQTVVHVHAPGMNLPRLALRLRRFFHVVGGLPGYQDIDLRADAAFAGRYHLRGADEAAVRAAFTAGAREVFERDRHLCAEGAGADLYLWHPSWTAMPDELVALVDTAVELASRLQAAAGAAGRGSVDRLGEGSFDDAAAKPGTPRREGAR